MLDKHTDLPGFRDAEAISHGWGNGRVRDKPTSMLRTGKLPAARPGTGVTGGTGGAAERA
ncbi:hypothetical protein F750_2852 [Streptomyces sp. PAMC 26508]|nr:hypothetical protein F750_2852 [Streptomyces sp. PAMC 26508]